MAKAHVVLENGTKVTVEGTSDEVAALVVKLGGGSSAQGAKKKKHKSAPGKKKAKVGPGDLVSDLINDGFFKKPKELGSIRIALQEQGHFYPVTTLSPVLLRLVKKKQLRRIKDKKRWTYIG